MSLLTPRLTDEGLSMIVAALNGDSITFTKAVIGNTTTAPAHPEQLTDVVGPMVTAAFTAITEGTNYVSLAAVFDNLEIEEGAYASELGLFAEDSNGNEKLYAYTYVGENADYIPVASSGRTVQNQMTIVVAVGDAEEVDAVLIDAAAYVTREEFEDHIDDHNNPHQVTKEQVGLGLVENNYFVDNTITVDQLTTASNLLTGDTLRQAMSKIYYWIAKILSPKTYLLAYPIGSIYMSVSPESPADIFGGTWERIQDTFLLAAGSAYLAGWTGGEATHTLTVNEMPAHAHYIKATYVYGIDPVGDYEDGYLEADRGAPGSEALDQYGNKGIVNAINIPPERGMHSTGGGLAHNNMPPYLAVYVWKRTA